MKALTDKEAYEIVRDNTSWTWVFPEDAKYKDGYFIEQENVTLCFTKVKIYRLLPTKRSLYTRT